MAPEDPPNGKDHSLDGAMPAKGLQGVLRTSRSKAAGRRFERGDADLIESYQEDEREREYFLDQVHSAEISFKAASIAE